MTNILKQSEAATKGVTIAAIKNSAIFTGKHLYWGLFLIMLEAFGPQHY